MRVALFAVKPLAVILPVFLVQYAVAVFALTRLALCGFPAKKYVLWNISIVLAFFVGPTAFLIRYYLKYKPETEAKEAESKACEAQETETPAESKTPSEREDGKTDGG